MVPPKKKRRELTDKKSAEATRGVIEDSERRDVAADLGIPASALSTTLKVVTRLCAAQFRALPVASKEARQRVALRSQQRVGRASETETAAAAARPATGLRSPTWSCALLRKTWGESAVHRGGTSTRGYPPFLPSSPHNHRRVYGGHYVLGHLAHLRVGIFFFLFSAVFGMGNGGWRRKSARSRLHWSRRVTWPPFEPAHGPF
ncbi:hypothetical protein HPB50_016098 [Hyalomma asiaticum]|uniref:Uncharacterized protein n=1 Tax=Hyalomma asiaticum TaxID=266040 RepID=A0ACB7T5P2_HYAAI|nr:hypothetical protein HPB50_016098 [Hyalomma asiaticum]